MENQDLIFAEANIGIIVSNSGGVIEKVNPFGASLFGYQVNELIGQKVEILLPKNVREHHVDLRSGYMSDPSKRPMGQERDLKALRKSGELFYVEVSLSYYRVDGQLFVVSFVNDVTESKKNRDIAKNYARELEKKVEERTKDLSGALMELNSVNQELQEEVNRREESERKVLSSLEKEKELSLLKTRFVSMASHEFRTPLGGILGSIDLIDKYIENGKLDKCQKHIKTIKSSVHNLTSILNDFLSVDKLEAGDIKAKPVRFSIKDKMEKWVNEFERIIPDGYEFDFELSDSSQIAFQDENIILNILLNLVSNAIKYGGEEKKASLVSMVSGNEWVITVSDSGIGISEEDQKLLFSRFHRGSNVTGIQGTGLGLSIIAKYLEYIDGEIEVSSKLNIGSSFIVRLPLELK